MAPNTPAMYEAHFAIQWQGQLIQLIGLDTKTISYIIDTKTKLILVDTEFTNCKRALK